MTDYEQILHEQRGDIVLLTINRPQRLNAWTPRMSAELVHAIRAANDDDSVGAIVLTGDGERAFAAGADIKELAVQNPTDLAREDPFTHWDRIRRIRKPIVAAVRGFALGGGLVTPPPGLRPGRVPCYTPPGLRPGRGATLLHPPGGGGFALGGASKKKKSFFY